MAVLAVRVMGVNKNVKKYKKRVMGVRAVHCSGDGPSDVEPFGSRFPKHLLVALHAL